MVTLSVVLGLAGALLVISALVGGGFTFSGSVMPTVGKAVRIPCFLVGAFLVLSAIGLATYEVSPPPGTRPSSNQSVDEVDSRTRSDPTPAIGTVAQDAYVFELPSLGSTTVGVLGVGEQVQIYCTAEGDTVTGQLGTSAIWDFVGSGFVPDAVVDTGSNSAVAPPCDSVGLT